MKASQRTYPSQVLFFLGATLVMGAALYRGGNMWLPLTLIEWLSLALLGLLIWGWKASSPKRTLSSPSGRVRVWALCLVMSSPLWVALLQLLPRPHSQQQAGANFLKTHLLHLAATGQASISALSAETWASALAGLPVVCCFTLALFLSQKQVSALVRLWLYTAVFQAGFGLLQLVAPSLTFDPLQSGVVSQGSFGSRNNFANYLAMLLPVALLWAVGSAQRHRQPSQQAPWLTGRKTWLSASALLLLLAALLASASRGGIATGVFVLLLAWALLPGSSGQHTKASRYWLPRLFPLALLGVAVASGGLEWLQRYEAGDPLRLLNWAGTWQAVQMFWPLGSGLGTFDWVYPMVQPPELGVFFVNFAHNDYLQLLMEGGALVLPVALALAALVVHRSAQLTAARLRAPWSEADALAVACGLGFLAQALHAWVDYPWRIPATAMLGAFLLGVFLRQPNSDFGRSRDLASQT